MTRALLIMGPTASGKSALALALALAGRLNGEIVNADSMQVYADLRVLTARPTLEEEGQAPHHLYGTVDAAERFSVGAWLRAASPLLADISARGHTPVVVGGTGLYFRALTHGLVEIPEPSPELRADLMARAERDGAEALHADLTARDPAVAATLGVRDAPRIIRALAVREATGVSIEDWRRDTRPVLAPGQWLGVALTPPRAPLYEAIDGRFGAMLATGALEEARALAARALDPGLPAMKAHGMPWLAAHFRGEMDLDEAAELGRRDTRRYAKRQFTWIAHQAPDWERPPEAALDDRIAHVCTLWNALDRNCEVD